MAPKSCIEPAAGQKLFVMALLDNAAFIQDNFDLGGMLLADAKNIREVILFPMNGQAQDLMMNAPSDADPAQLKELYLKHLPIEE